MSIRITLEIPDGALLGIAASPDAFGDEMRLAAAVKWYELGRISQGKAAEIAGKSRSEFLDALGRFGASPFQTTPEELAAELGIRAPAG